MKILELFGGIGAPREALRILGHKPKSIYVEIDKYPVKFYNQAFRETFTPSDVREFSCTVKFDLCIHGSPCQDFSPLGSRHGISGKKSSLLLESLRIISETLPTIVVWENVSGVLYAENNSAFSKYLIEMRKMGYINYYRVLSAKDFGIPQSRPRLFVVSKRVPGFSWPKPIKLERSFVEYLENDVTTDYLTETAISRVKKKRRADRIYDGCCFDFRNDHPKVTIYPKGIHGCITLSSGSGACIFVNGRFRKLTGIESLRLQGWSNDRIEQGRPGLTNYVMQNLAGNSICIPVIQAIFKQLGF